MPIGGIVAIYFFGGVSGFNPYSTDADKAIVYHTMLVVFTSSGVVPVIIAVVLKKLNLISSLHMPKKEERSLPFILTSLCYIGAFYYLKSTYEAQLNGLILYFIFFGAFATVLGFFITLSWKISVHMIGIGGIVGILTLLSKVGNDVLLLPLCFAIGIAGLIGFGRLQLKAHKVSQIIAGFLLGFSCEILGLFFLISH